MTRRWSVWFRKNKAVINNLLMLLVLAAPFVIFTFVYSVSAWGRVFQVGWDLFALCGLSGLVGRVVYWKWLGPGWMSWQVALLSMAEGTIAVASGFILFDRLPLSRALFVTPGMVVFGIDWLAGLILNRFSGRKKDRSQ